MLNNFIYAQTKDLFLDNLEAGNILDEAIVFIEDTKEIWNHGHYFGSANVPTKTSQLENDSDFLTYDDLATIATTGDYNDLSNTPSEVTESTVSG